MITLLASIAGFVTSMIPEIVKFAKDKNDKKHELDILSMQMTMSKLSRNANIDEIKCNINANEFATLYSTFKTGIHWIDALNGTVRPVMAYSFFFLYSFIKYIQYKTILIKDASGSIYCDLLWTTDDQAIFAGIISFYFGQRTFGKIWRQK
ncbi:MAG: hypothetical protein EB127_17875 [Alphaproteobacteria bacterium]|nr:hypothetical protein [Alphaproteobacteria bacterium]